MRCNVGRFKIVDNGYIIGVGINQSPSDKITETEYDMLADKIKQRPTAPGGYHYMLRNDTLGWELVKDLATGR